MGMGTLTGTIGTMLNFEGDCDGHGNRKQTLTYIQNNMNFKISICDTFNSSFNITKYYDIKIYQKQWSKL